MSILGQSSNSLLSGSAIFLIPTIFVSIPLAIALKVFRPAKVAGPDRLSPLEPVIPLVIALSMGFFAFMSIAAFYSTVRKLTPGPNGQSPTLSGSDTAFLSIFPPLAACLAMLVGDFALGGLRLIAGLGIRFKRFAHGIMMGVIGAMIIVPPTYFVVSFIDWFYHRVQYAHPTEHELLKAMKDSHERPATQWLLIFAAVIVAPVVEEIFFRAHLQTIIRRVFVFITLRLTEPPQPAGIGFPVLFPLDMPVAAPVLPIPLPEPAPRKFLWQTWAAIVITSLLFGFAHPLWMAPAIFFLSLGLGYCYERTGNIWTNVTVHCLFNSFSTLIFLLTRS